MSDADKRALYVEPQHLSGTAERLAVLYSDGGAGIMEHGRKLEEAIKEAEFCDLNEKDKHHLCHVARVQITVLEVLSRPEGTTEQLSELEALRKENADLRAKIAKEE